MSCCETDACNVPSSGRIVALGKSVFVFLFRLLILSFHLFLLVDAYDL